MVTSASRRALLSRWAPTAIVRSCPSVALARHIHSVGVSRKVHCPAASTSKNDGLATILRLTSLVRVSTTAESCAHQLSPSVSPQVLSTYTSLESGEANVQAH